MKELVSYQCEICGCEFREKQDALKCEKDHVEMIPSRIVRTHKPIPYPSAKPVGIIVELRNGEQWDYVPRNRLGPPPESDMIKYLKKKTGKTEEVHE